MTTSFRVLGLIPARGGSKGVPRKNIRPLAGKPLIAHTISVARAAASLTRTVVSTDDAEIARVARECGGDVPFMRPDDLASDTAAMWPVVRHALVTMEALDGVRYDALALLDPTNPFRAPSEIDAAVATLASDPAADGVIGVVEPDANPLWHSVVEDIDGYLADLVPNAGQYVRRQDVPAVYSINGALYVWRRECILQQQNWRHGKLRRQLVADVPFTPIDSEAQFRAVDALVRAGIVPLPT